MSEKKSTQAPKKGQPLKPREEYQAEHMPGTEPHKRRRLVQLSLVPNLVPAANVAIRSCMFSTSRGPRKYYEEFTPVATWGDNLKVSIEREELRQDDMSVWIQLCKEAVNNDNFEFDVTMYRLIKRLGLTDAGNNRKEIKARLERLNTTRFQILYNDIEYYGYIVPSFGLDHKNKRVKGSLDPLLSKLLGMMDFTMLDNDVRNSLTPSGQWFHAFVKSHQGPDLFIPWEKVMELSGSNAKIETFRKEMKKTILKPLTEKGFLITWRTTKKGVFVTFDKSKG